MFADQKVVDWNDQTILILPKSKTRRSYFSSGFYLFIYFFDNYFIQSDPRGQKSGNFGGEYNKPGGGGGLGRGHTFVFASIRSRSRQADFLYKHSIIFKE